jgi:nucleoside-diphosphate-sugar epimerase
MKKNYFKESDDCIMSGTGKTILVTGGGGYIGSHCIVELLKEDFDVIVVDNFVNCIKGIDPDSPFLIL